MLPESIEVMSQKNNYLFQHFMPKNASFGCSWFESVSPPLNSTGCALTKNSCSRVIEPNSGRSTEKFQMCLSANFDKIYTCSYPPLESMVLTREGLVRLTWRHLDSISLCLFHISPTMTSFSLLDTIRLHTGYSRVITDTIRSSLHWVLPSTQ